MIAGFASAARGCETTAVAQLLGLLSLRLQAGLDLRRERRPDPRHGRYLLHWRLTHSLGRAEDPQKRGTPFRPHARQVVERGAGRGFGPQGAVVSAVSYTHLRAHE